MIILNSSHAIPVSIHLSFELLGSKGVTDKAVPVKSYRLQGYIHFLKGQFEWWVYEGFRGKSIC